MAELPPLEMDPLPTIDLRHLFVLTDDTAILQHATRSTPNLHHGYCTDDTARALIATVQLLSIPEEDWASSDPNVPGVNDVRLITQRYLAFLAYAFNEETGRFRNFMHYDRSWLEETGSEDSHARTIWALGKAVRLAPSEDIQALANQIMLKALPPTEGFDFLRPWAYTLLGVDSYLIAEPEQHLAEQIRFALAERLYETWKAHAEEDWPWWEDELTWGNAKLPHALMAAATALQREEILDAALQSLRWLLEVQTGQAGQLSVIGNNGWFVRGREPARFDQQPIEAKALVQACLAAATLTGDSHWCSEAKRSFEWFTGRNDVGVSLVNAETGGGHDGLLPTGVNRNQGAESTLAYLLSVLEIHQYDFKTRAQPA